MPTMDLDASLRTICRRDGRYKAEAYQFVLEALDHTLTRRSAAASGGSPGAASPSPPPATPSPGLSRTGSSTPPSNVTGRDLLEGFRDLALERFGALAREVLRTWGVQRTDDVGALVFNMVEAGLLQKTSSDSPEDYRAVFDFEAAFDRGFEDRLRREEVRLSDRPAERE
jgi:uncharacterized repeat protein (TIGR04138 family)